MGQGDEFGERLLRDVEDAEEAGAVGGGGAGVVVPDLEEAVVLVGGVDALLDAFRDVVWAEDDCARRVGGDGAGGHGGNEWDGVLAWCVGDVDWAAGEGAGGGVVGGVLVHVAVSVCLINLLGSVELEHG